MSIWRLGAIGELEVNTDSSTTQNFSHFMATKAECLAAVITALDTISVHTGTKPYIICHMCHVNMTKYGLIIFNSYSTGIFLESLLS